ncbi:sulfite exporter TauE/SafE family protein [Antrihabitans cavernicola]|uniref:Probable membrane transporter protein n=1 Tax=Antrihabitans cavernicola TaxID=2495913 RepID=A0A5A7S734_9NOCA|nr:sulfite exporter TauE/SafE family protein [Spelaeibacter cavernicola]KAA0021696.1 sulfite exporter TauE/SafE family protein [Spelaeibacter cavernicola]
MSLLDFLLIVVAGFFAGLIGFITGMASLVSYPALLAIGLGPVAANVTNTVGMVAVGLGALANSGRALADTGPKLRRWAAAAALGGVVGAVLLLVGSDGAFEAIVPYLVAMAAIAVLLQPKLRALAGEAEFARAVPIGVFAVAVYGGYFGAGAGVIFLALFLISTSESMWRASILKSFLLGIANLVAAIGFAIFGPVHWLAALAMAIGAFAGGWCGPPTVKVIPPQVLRISVGILGLGLAGWLGLH